MTITLAHRTARVSRASGWCALALAAAGVLGLGGCAAAAPDASPTAAAVNSHDVAVKFGDCLTAHGIAGIFVGDDGVVGLSFTAGPNDSTAGAGGTVVGPDDGAYSSAEEACKNENPDYHDGSVTADPAMLAQLVAHGRTFSACARSAGLTTFSDPAADGSLPVPEGTTKQQFLAVVKSCASAFMPGGASTSPDPGAATAPDAAGGPRGSGDAGTFTIALPQFTGAYEPAWEGEVDQLLFAAMPAVGAQQ